MPVLRCASRSGCRRCVPALPRDRDRRASRLGSNQRAAGAMVTASLSATPAAENAGLAIWGAIEVIAVVGWILLFATLLIYMAVLLTSRRRTQRRRDAAPRIVTRVGTVPPGLDALRRADPGFDEQVLLDAALTATFLMFAATSTGNEAPIRRVVTESFWATPFGVVTRTNRARPATRGRRSREEPA